MVTRKMFWGYSHSVYFIWICLFCGGVQLVITRKCAYIYGFKGLSEGNYWHVQNTNNSS